MPFKKPLECKQCSFAWVPRVPTPKFCAKCHSPKWDNKIKMQNRKGLGVRVKHSDIGIKG